MRGAIPAELVKEAKGGEVHVDMEDHRSYLMEVCCRPHSSERTRCKIALARTMEKLLLPGVLLHCNYNSITNEFHLREEEFVREKVKAKPFQGSGNVLGSKAPAVAPPAADASLDPKQVIYLDAT